MVHRPVSAGSFILKSEAELLRERRHEEAQERQRKNELAKQKKVESVDHLRSTADFQLTANTEQGHEPQPTRETVEPDPGSNQRSSTRTDEGDGHPDQAIGGRPFSSSTDKARSKPHGRYIIARSAILQVRVVHTFRAGSGWLMALCSVGVCLIGSTNRYLEVEKTPFAAQRVGSLTLGSGWKKLGRYSSSFNSVFEKCNVPTPIALMNCVAIASCCNLKAQKRGS